MAAPAENTDNGKESVFDRLTGTQKSAILMMLIGEDEASEILRNLSPREVQHLGTAMYSVQGLDQETVNLVLDEFLSIIKAQTSLGMGAGNYIRNVMVKALGEDKSQSVCSAGAAIFITLHYICLHLVRRDFSRPAQNLCGKY